VVVEDQELATAKEEAKALPFIRPAEVLREMGSPRAPERRVEPARTVVEAPPLAPAPSPPPPQHKPVSRTIEIERFVPLRDLGARYFEKPYYIVPNGPVAEEAYTVIREAMNGKEVAALGHVVLSSRERPIAIHPLGVGLQGMTLRYPYEVRSEAEYFADVPSLALPKDMLQLASHIVDTMQAEFDPALLNDRERAALVGMLKEKQRALPQQVERKAATPSAKNVVNLMDALKRSVAAAATEPSSRRAKSPLPRRRKPARQ
jgi:DNA end-binding protein Ku